jgi:hypothetical protein
LYEADDRDNRRPRRGRRQEDDEDYDDDDYGRWSNRPIRRRSLAAIRSKVAPPAIFLMVYSVLLILCGLGAAALAGFGAWRISSAPKQFPQSDKEDAVMMVVIGGMCAVVAFLAGPIILWGAIRMNALRSYGLAMTATILSSAVGIFVCIALTLVGIWPLVVLLDPDVREAFNRPLE